MQYSHVVHACCTVPTGCVIFSYREEFCLILMALGPSLMSYFSSIGLKVYGLILASAEVTYWHCINFIANLGGRLMKMQFAFVDESDNFSFTYVTGFNDTMIYPGELLKF